MSDLPAVYDNPVYQQFRRDAEARGFTVTHYQGRFHYDGPAVVVADEAGAQRLIRVTTGVIQRDQFRLGFILYPVYP